MKLVLSAAANAAYAVASSGITSDATAVINSDATAVINSDATISDDSNVFEIEAKYIKPLQYIANYFDNDLCQMESFKEDFYLPANVRDMKILTILLEKFLKPCLDSKHPLRSEIGEKVKVSFAPKKTFFEDAMVPEWFVTNIKELDWDEVFSVLEYSDLLGFEELTSHICLYVAHFYTSLSFDERDAMFPLKRDTYSLQVEKDVCRANSWIFDKL